MKIKCTLLAFFALFMFACKDGGPTSPTTFSHDTTATLNTFQPQNEDVPVADTSSTVTDSDISIIGLDRAGITVTTTCGGLVDIYVPAKNASYVDVWIPRVNDGVKYGHFPVNEEFSIALPPGNYEFQLAVELLTEKELIQDDRHHGRFNIGVCSNPIPPNNPPPPPVDVCLNLEGVQETVPEGYLADGTFCYIPEVPVDVCPNIQGDQESIPEGLILDDSGNCVEPEVPTEPEGKCFYEISGSIAGRNKTYPTKEAACTANGGAFGVDGDGHDDGSDHCVFNLPGIAKDGFNLAPGISADSCLTKQDAP